MRGHHRCSSGATACGDAVRPGVWNNGAPAPSPLEEGFRARDETTNRDAVRMGRRRPGALEPDELRPRRRGRALRLRGGLRRVRDRLQHVPRRPQRHAPPLGPADRHPLRHRRRRHVALGHRRVDGPGGRPVGRDGPRAAHRRPRGGRRARREPRGARGHAAGPADAGRLAARVLRRRSRRRRVRQRRRLDARAVPGLPGPRCRRPPRVPVRHPAAVGHLRDGRRRRRDRPGAGRPRRDARTSLVARAPRHRAALPRQRAPPARRHPGRDLRPRAGRRACGRREPPRGAAGAGAAQHPDR